MAVTRIAAPSPQDRLHPMSRLTVHTLQTAPEGARVRVEGAQRANGFLPNLIGVLAGSPQALAMYQEVGVLNAASSLDAGEREVVQLTAAAVNACGFCTAGHTALTRKKQLLSDDVLAALRAQHPLPHARLDALARFTRAVILSRGAADDAVVAEFFAAGYTEQNALDVVLGVALATLCNYANNLARTPLNPELRAYA